MSNKFCQSCGMPLSLHGDDVRGTEKDGSAASLYCHFCYQHGTWVEPQISMEQMKHKGLTAIKNGEGGALKKWLMAAFYPMQLKGLKRWKQ